MLLNLLCSSTWSACIAIMFIASTNFLQLPLKAVSLTSGLQCTFRLLSL